MKFELLKSEMIYKGHAFTLSVDDLRTPDNRIVKYDIIHHAGSVVIVPIDSDGNILFVRQYRHAANTLLLELPAGTRNGNEDPLECARRETREEIGMNANNLQKLGSMYLAPGYSTELMHIFLATELNEDPLDADEDEFLQVEKISTHHVAEMVINGELLDAKTLAALFLAQKYF